jgi:2-methylcitrate dehydratase PrpD
MSHVAPTAFNASASLTSSLVDLIKSKPISDKDFHGAAMFALDAIANIAGGTCSEDTGAVFAWARSEPLSTGRKAFVLGACASVLELDAMHRESAVHAGTVVVPALLAIAQGRQFGGRDFLTALLKGSEAAFRVGRAAGPSHYKIYQNTATCGPYGSAMATALLLDLDNAQTVHALGNAGTQSSGLWEYRDTGAMTKQLHAGRAAESGIIAAQLAARGFTGPLKILEGSRGFFRAACPDADPGAVLRNPEGEWGLLGSSIKPWPSSRHTHPAIDAALGLSVEMKGRQVESADIEAYQVTLDLCGNANPQTPHQAKSSVQYCVAAALNDGRVDLSSFSAEAFARNQALTRKITLKAAEPFASAYPKAWGAQVLVRFTDGTQSICARKNVKGDPEAPLSEEELKDKARALLQLGGIADPEPLMQSILRMANDAPCPALSFNWA